MVGAKLRLTLPHPTMKIIAVFMISALPLIICSIPICPLALHTVIGDDTVVCTSYHTNTECIAGKSGKGSCVPGTARYCCALPKL